jgi:hypothetical protein
MQGTSKAHILVLVELDSDVQYKHWTGKNVKSIRKAVKNKYPAAKLYFGNVWYTNSYGAH